MTVAVASTHKHVEKDPKITDEIWVQPWDFFFFLLLYPAFHFSLLQVSTSTCKAREQNYIYVIWAQEMHIEYHFSLSIVRFFEHFHPEYQSS